MMVRGMLFCGLATLATVPVAHAEVSANPPQQVAIDANLFDGYVGYYQLSPSLVLTVTRVGDHLLIKNTGAPTVEIFPESKKDFFYKEIPIRLSFDTDRRGQAKGVIIHGASHDIPAKRIDAFAASQVEDLIKPDVAVALDPQLIDGYIGSYKLAPDAFMTISRDGDRLFAQPTGQPRYEIFQKADRLFFVKPVDAQITFVTDKGGKATGIVLHQKGKDLTGARVHEAESQKADQIAATRLADQKRERTEVTIDPKLFERYVGHYALRPDFILTIYRDGEHLFAQGTAQEQAEIFAENEKSFFYKEVPIQITFVTKSSRGKATHVILHQSGQEIAAKRID